MSTHNTEFSARGTFTRFKGTGLSCGHRVALLESPGEPLFPRCPICNRVWEKVRALNQEFLERGTPQSAKSRSVPKSKTKESPESYMEKFLGSSEYARKLAEFERSREATYHARRERVKQERKDYKSALSNATSINDRCRDKAPKLFKTAKVLDPTRWNELEGELKGVYLNSLRRGYLGGPQHWLKFSRTARRSCEWFKGIHVNNKNPLLCWKFQPKQSWVRLSEAQRQVVERSKTVTPIRMRCPRSEVHQENKKRVFPRRYDGPFPNLPSAPTLGEWWSVARNGKIPVPTTLGPTAITDRVSQSEFRSNLKLRRSIVRKEIFALRSDVEVPKKLLGCFDYSRNFLIPRIFPARLVGFLLDVWKHDPHSLWLRCGHLHLRQYLRMEPGVSVNRLARHRGELLARLHE